MRTENIAGNAASQVNRTLWLYALLVELVTLASWAKYGHLNDFQARPLFAKYDQFHDLTNYIGKTVHLHGGAAALGSGLPVFNYPAPAAYVYKILLHTFPGHEVRTYLSFLAICTLGFALVVWRACRVSRTVLLSTSAAIAATAVLGYPMWFTADRGNIEGVVWALAGAGLCFLLRQRYGTAAILIGIATSIKPFSILFLLLPLGRRRYKEVLLGAVTAGLVMLAALTALGPNPWKAYQDLRPGVSLYISRYIMNLAPLEEIRFDHSLLDGMKATALTVEMGGFRPHKALIDVPRLMDEPGGWHVAHSLVRVYPFVAIAGFGLVCAVFYKMPILNQVTALAVMFAIIPPVSGDYTLLQLYIPFGALLVFLTREVAVGNTTLGYGSMLALAVIYALLFSPLTFLLLYAGYAKLLLLLALLVVAARSPMRSEYFGDLVVHDAMQTNSQL